MNGVKLVTVMLVTWLGMGLCVYLGYINGKSSADRWYAKQPQPICAPVTLQENQDFIISVPYTYTFMVSNDELWPEHITVDFKASKGKP